ncbi:MAG: hypothetical protein AB7K09_11155 [Planctomycetota bacterium]
MTTYKLKPVRPMLIDGRCRRCGVLAVMKRDPDAPDDPPELRPPCRCRSPQYGWLKVPEPPDDVE